MKPRQVGEFHYMMARLYSQHKLLQFWETASKKWKQLTLELKINHTWNNQDDASQTTDDQFQDDYWSWLDFLHVAPSLSL